MRPVFAVLISCCTAITLSAADGPSDSEVRKAIAEATERALSSAAADSAAASESPSADTSADPAAPPYQLSGDERTELNQLVERVYRDALPEVRGTQLVLGSISCQGVAVGDQVTAGAVSTWTDRGIHFRGSEGTWWQHGVWLFSPTVTVTPGPDLVDSANDHALPDPGWNGDWRTQWLERYQPQVHPIDLPRLHTALNGLPIISASGIRYGPALPVLAIQMLRQGHQAADSLAIAVSIMSLWDESANVYWDTTPQSIYLGAINTADPMIDGDDSFFSEGMLEEADETPVAENALLPSVVQTLRRGLFVYLSQQLLTTHIRKNPNVVALDPTAVLALLDDLLVEPADAEAREHLRLLRSRLDMNPTAPPGTDLVARVRAWNPYKTPAKPPATEADLDALLALADDQRASAWIDDGNIFTVGEAALRILGDILGCDPRLVIGRDTETPWTSAEHQAVVAALRQWRRENPSMTAIAAVTPLVPTLSPPALLSVLAARTPSERRTLLDLVAEAWVVAPTDSDPTILAGLIPFLLDHPTCAAQVQAWPISGEYAHLLALVHARLGDTSALTAQVDAFLADPTNTPAALFFLGATPEQVQHGLAALADPDLPLATILLQQVAYDNFQEWPGVLSPDPKQGQRRSAMTRASVLVAALGNQRQLTAEQQQQLLDRSRHRRRSHMTDVRVADAIADRCAGFATGVGSVLDLKLPEPAFTLDAPIAKRDEAINTLFVSLLRQLAAIGKQHDVPFILPLARSARAGDAESLY